MKFFVLEAECGENKLVYPEYFYNEYAAQKSVDLAKKYFSIEFKRPFQVSMCEVDVKTQGGIEA